MSQENRQHEEFSGSIKEGELSIADRLLQQLEDEYNYVHSFNNKSYSATHPDTDPDALPQKQENDNEQEQNSQEEGYQKIGENCMDSDSEDSSENEHAQQKLNNNPETPQFIEVGPVPQSVFSVPEKDFKIQEEQKIKKYALGMEIETPEWAKNQQNFQKRILELFKMNKKQ